MAAHTTLLSTQAETLALLLPSAQLEIMRIVWSAKEPLTVKQVHEQIAKTRPVAYTTIMTTMLRLHEKGLLDRKQEREGYGASYLYTPIVNERELIERTVYQMLDCVVRDYPSVLTEYLDTRREYAAN